MKRVTAAIPEYPAKAVASYVQQKAQPKFITIMHAAFRRFLTERGYPLATGRLRIPSAPRIAEAGYGYIDGIAFDEFRQRTVSNM
jgi:hypothetical protein